MKKVISLLLVFCFAFVFISCQKNEDNHPSTDNSVETSSSEFNSDITQPTFDLTSTTEQQISDTTVPTSEATSVFVTEAPSSEVPVSQPPVSETPVTDAPTTLPPETEAPATNPPVDNTPAGILNVLSTAVNKTKGYKSNITVNHKEEFNIVEPVVKLDKGGETFSKLATRAINFVKDLVLKPGEEVYNFSNGIATTSENEKTQLLLPKDKAFNIGVDAVASAQMTNENGLTHIKLTLTPEETHSLAQVPQNHANSIGYLDLDGEFKIIQIQELDIKYPGSTIDAFIRPDGYVQSVTYTINLEAYSKASGMGLTGTATFSGSQTEVWNINW